MRVRQLPPTWRATGRSRASICPTAQPIQPGTRLVTGDYAETLRSIAREGAGNAVRRRTGPALRRPYGEIRRLHHAGRPDALSHHRPRGAARHLSRLRDRRSAAAVIRPAAHHPDAEHPGGLRHRRARLRVRGHAASAGRGHEDRLRRSRRCDRRSGIRASPRGEAAVQGVRGRAPRAHLAGRARSPGAPALRPARARIPRI